jgi:signal transduction histidine kinase
MCPKPSGLPRDLIDMHKSVHSTPRHLIIIVICTLCLGLFGSALFTFITLSRLRTYYLSNRGLEIASVIESQVRGPGRRNNPAFWQSILETNYETYASSVVFLALVDQNGNPLAGAGKLPMSFLEKAGTVANGIYYFEEMLPHPRNPRGEGGHATADWRIRVGLYSADADFIRRMAFLQLVVSGLAIVALVVLSIYLIRMLNRFIELKTREAAEAQLKSLGIMAASLAHEIRNPLGAMKGLTQLAQEELPTDHAAQTHLRTVVNEAERLEKLVTDLLDFARTKEPQVSEFNLAELLSDIKTMLQSRLDASKAELQFSIDPNPFLLQSDPAGLRQVLLNVLINAIDATPARGIVVLTAMHEEDHKSILIRIDDTGEGFGQHNPEELFQPFVTTKARGTGLGLAVSKQIVESLGGSLDLENLPQGGARCSIMLPMR